jgi:outer membrane protein assembly factor BamB
VKKSFIFVLVGLALSACGSLKKYTEPQTLNEREKLVPRWTKNLDPVHDTGNLPIAVHSPLVHEGLLFVGTQSGNMLAFDAKTGRELWRGEEGASYHSRPGAYGDQVIYGTAGGRVYSRHMLTGEIKYAVDLDAPIESEPVIYKGRLFFHLRNHKIFCLDVESGKILWAYRRSVPYPTTIQRVSAPTVHNDKVIVGFADGNVASFSLEEGVLLWERKLGTGTKFVDVDANPVIVDGKLLIGPLAGSLSLIEPQSGNLLQSFDITISKTPFLYKDKIYLGTTDGELVIMDRNFIIKERTTLSQGSLTAINAWKDHLVVTSSRGEVFLLSEEGDVVEKKVYGHVYSAVFGDITTSEGILAILSSRNRLYVY